MKIRIAQSEVDWYLNLFLGAVLTAICMVVGIRASYELQETFRMTDAMGELYPHLFVWGQATAIAVLGAWLAHALFRVETSERWKIFFAAQLWFAVTGLGLGAFFGTMFSRAALYFLLSWLAVTMGVILGAGPDRLRRLKDFILSP